MTTCPRIDVVRIITRNTSVRENPKAQETLLEVQLARDGPHK